MDQRKKSLIIASIVMGVSALLALLIMTRPGADVDGWVIFTTAILYPVFFTFLVVKATKENPKDKKK